MPEPDLREIAQRLVNGEDDLRFHHLVKNSDEMKSIARAYLDLTKPIELMAPLDICKCGGGNFAWMEFCWKCGKGIRWT